MDESTEPSTKAELDISGFYTSLVVRQDRRQIAYHNLSWGPRGVVEAADQALTDLGYQRTGAWQSAGRHPSPRQIQAAGGWYTAPLTALPG